MKKKWITKAEITKILTAYSIRKNEFVPVGDNEYFYQSQIVRGYTVSIAPEKSVSKDFSEKTGRIIVSHTQHNGRKTFNDVWERNHDGCLQFRFRNLWNQPFSDADYIRELEDKYHRVLIIGKELQDKLRETIKETNSDSLSLSCQIEKLQAENERLQQKLALCTKHNARNAGRKPSQERLNAIEQVKDLLATGCSDKKIMDTLGISRATYYRYKKSINN